MHARPGGTIHSKLAVVDVTLIMLLAAALVWPLFNIEYFENWMSIDGAFISDARFLREHLPHPGWQPLWYTGTRFDYVYPPAIRFGTAVLSILTGMSVARSYHFYSAVFYVLAIVSVYVLARAGTQSRASAWLAAAFSAFLSPIFLLIGDIREDSPLHMPQRLNVIVKWGEVPHMSALALLGLGLACTWFALPARRPRLLVGGALLFALAVSNNFYGAVALALFFPVMVFSLWVAHGGREIWIRALGMALLTYAFTAFWLTPSYVGVTVRNLTLVAVPGQWSSRLLLGVLILVWGALAWRFARQRPDRVWIVFLTGSFIIFGLNAIGRYYGNLRIVGEPHRFIPEADLILILLAVEGLRSRAWGGRASSAAVLAASLLVALPYVRNPWGVYVPDLHPERRVEYRLADWIAKNLPDSRVYLTGSLSFWANAWHNIPQVSGGSAQGLLNMNIAMVDWQLLIEDNGPRDIQWLYATGADAIAVHLPQSTEIFHAIRHPEKFSVLPVLFDDREGNIIYRVPRRFPGLARVVQRDRMAGLIPIPLHTENIAPLRSYVEALERGPDAPAPSEWLDSRRMLIRAKVARGQAVTALVSWDPAWRATANGRELTVFKDANNFMLIDAPPGEHEILLEFKTPLENQIGALGTVAALAIAGIAFCRT